MTKIRWLHLSDLHCGMPDPERRWSIVKERFFADLTQRLEGAEPLDLLLFTGGPAGHPRLLVAGLSLGLAIALALLAYFVTKVP